MCLLTVTLNFLFLDHKAAAFGVRVRDYKSNLAGKKLRLCSNALI